MDFSALQSLAAGASKNHQRNSTGGMNAHLDLLSQFGGDINSAVAAAAALQSVGSGQNQHDHFAAVANLNALAQLNQLATANPKVAAMLQLQQQLGAMNQQTNHHPSSSNNYYQGASTFLITIYSSDHFHFNTYYQLSNFYQAITIKLISPQ